MRSESVIPNNKSKHTSIGGEKHNQKESGGNSHQDDLALVVTDGYSDQDREENSECDKEGEHAGFQGFVGAGDGA